MMTLRTETQRWLTFYGLPVLISFGGIVYAQQLQGLAARSVVIFISLALPLCTGGNLLARYRTRLSERVIMFVIFLLLLSGAAYSLLGIADSLSQTGQVGVFEINLSRVLGMLSLFLGLFVVLISVIRTGSDADEIADRFKFVGEHISEGLILSQPDGSIILVNQQVLRMFGMTEESVIGRNVRQIASALGLNLVVRHFDDRTVGISSEYEIIWEKKDDYRVLLISGAPILNKRGRHLLTLATVRDITEQREVTRRFEKRAEDLQEQIDQQTRKLHRSERWLRHLLYTMHEGFLTVDSQYRVQLVNDQAAALFKSDKAGMQGRSIFEYVTKVGHSRLLNLFMHAMQETGGKGLRQELEFVNTEGNLLPALIGVVYLNDPENMNAGYSLAITPIAELKRMQQQLLSHTHELERVNEELRSHDRAKDGFLSNVTHELRTPLTTVRGYLEMLLDGNMGVLTEPQRNALMIMDRNSKHLLNSINEMIDFSRMQIRGIQAIINLYDAAAIGREAAAAFLPAATEKKVHLSTNLPEGPLFAWGDREKLHQVLGILLNNAVKFTEPGGTITLSVECENNSTVIFSVADTGIGIDPVNREKIFERFFQVDKSKARKYEGAGIGLAIARTIIEAHEGTITVQSEPDCGSIFVITLPDSVFVREVDADINASLEAVHVLVVEESEERRNAFSSFAPFDRASVSFVPNGYQIGRQTFQETPDLIIINDAPADVAGETSLRVLRQQTTTMEAPVIVLTNERRDVLQRMFIHESHVRFLYKPFAAATLVRQMQRCVHGGMEMETQELDTLFPSRVKKPLALVIDTDPGFLEWVDTALTYYEIDVCCVSSPERMSDSGVLMKTPDAVFVDGDMPGRQLDELLRLLRSHPATEASPIFLFAGGMIKNDALKTGQFAGILHKPFPISDMTEIIVALKKNVPVKSSG